MLHGSFKMQLVFMVAILTLQMDKVLSYKRNYEAKYTKANIPLWKQRACEKAQKYKANSHYICDDKGDVKCLPGWQGDLCQVPMCRKGCDPMNGYCQRPAECRCRIGYTGELCDKCIPLPGCQHGDCTKPFECICRSGWDGLFCTEPTCRRGCHNTRGYCDTPGECRCRIGWAGRNCSDCSVLPGCQHGTCTKPLECQCSPGYTGLLCQTPICHADCHKQHGWCKKPGECRCKIGWMGVNCDKCFPYPGCVNGDCEKPWECNCKPGWGGILCDEELTYCREHPNTCENNGKCISLIKEDGSYRCHCKQGFLGKNCEIVDEFLLTSTTAPHITPPPLIVWQEEDNDGDLSNENELQSSLENKEKEKELLKPNKNATSGDNEQIEISKKNHTLLAANATFSLSDIMNLDNVSSNKSSAKQESLESKGDQGLSVTDKKNSTDSPLDIPMTSETFNKSNILNVSLISLNTTESLALKPNISKISSTSTTIPLLHLNTSISASTTLSPLSKLEDEKNLHNIPLKPTTSNKKSEEETDEDDDEECTDDNDEDCEYVDEDEEDDDDF